MAVFSTIGSIIAGNSQNKANARAADTSTQNNRANIDFATRINDQNVGILSPFVQRGNAAGNQINALLGLGGSQVQGGPAQATFPGQQPNALSQFQGYPGGAGAPYGISDTPGYAPPRAGGFAGGVLNNALDARNSAYYNNRGTGALAGVTPQTTQSAVPQQTAQQAAQNGFDIFRNSTGYQFRLGEGLDARTSAYSGIGAFQSGAALRGIEEYGQNLGSNEFGNYVNALGAQQATGAGAASSLAGVGQNFAGTVIGANNSNTQNQIAAQLGRQNPFANALGTIGGASQQAVGAFLGGGFG